MVKKRTCVFISGKGTNLKNLISYSRDKSFPIKISLIICNNNKAEGIKYAKWHNIPLILVNTKNKNSDNKILLQLKNYKISFICLAGYMKIISNKIIKEFRDKIINIHPSLLPKFKGLNTFSRVLKNKEIKSGCTVHYVNDKLDAGHIIKSKKFFLIPSDNETTLKHKTQNLEYKAFPQAIISIFRYR